MKIILVIILVITILIMVCLYFRKKAVIKRKLINNELDPAEISNWKRNRRKNRRPISLDVEAMGNNIEKSHDLWKSLSKIVHESKWIGKNQEKIELAAELNSLINQHKTNFRELQKLEVRINNELLSK